VKVLVIKLGALGDFVQATVAMRRIREAHPDAKITLLTTPPFAPLAEATGWFDAIETDGRPEGLMANWRMLCRLKAAHYDRVYDLQTSSRSSAYFQFLRPHPPAWSGIATGASLPHANPDRDRMHTLERQADQLKYAGVWPDAPTQPGTAPAPDLSFLAADTPAPEQPYVLLIPGGSAHRLDKRWPAGRYAQLARHLRDAGYEVVIVGGPQETPIAEEIGRIGSGVTDMTGKTDFLQLARLAARASLAVGNDTGPTHLIAAAGAPTLVLFSQASDPALCAPRGRVEVLRRDSLEDLSVAEVVEAADAILNEKAPG
jgi:ADP-heptose:LPS heptosyltransferase